jgi:hypothetical protein
MEGRSENFERANKEVWGLVSLYHISFSSSSLRHGLTLALSSAGEFLVWLSFPICLRGQQGLSLPPPSAVLLTGASPQSASPAFLV